MITQGCTFPRSDDGSACSVDFSSTGDTELDAVAGNSVSTLPEVKEVTSSIEGCTSLLGSMFSSRSFRTVGAGVDFCNETTDSELSLDGEIFSCVSTPFGSTLLLIGGDTTVFFFCFPTLPSKLGSNCDAGPELLPFPLTSPDSIEGFSGRGLFDSTLGFISDGSTAFLVDLMTGSFSVFRLVLLEGDFSTTGEVTGAIGAFGVVGADFWRNGSGKFGTSIVAMVVGAVDTGTGAFFDFEDKCDVDTERGSFRFSPRLEVITSFSVLSLDEPTDGVFLGTEGSVISETISCLPTTSLLRSDSICFCF